MQDKLLSCKSSFRMASGFASQVMRGGKAGRVDSIFSYIDMGYSFLSQQSNQHVVFHYNVNCAEKVPF